MAKATKKEVTTVSVTLELTEKEAQRLREVLGGISSWSPKDQPSLDAIYKALEPLTRPSGVGVFSSGVPKLLPEE